MSTMAGYFRCDICARISLNDTDRLLMYGAAYHEKDGTFTFACLECYQGWCQLTPTERRATYKPVPCEEQSLRQMLDSLLSPDESQTWDRDKCAAMRYHAIRMNCICTEDARCIDTFEQHPEERRTFDCARLDFLRAQRDNGSSNRKNQSATYILDMVNKTTQISAGSKAVSMSCVHCRTLEPPGTRFPVCQQCRVMHYCSVECQRKDWQRHKRICKK